MRKAPTRIEACTQHDVELHATQVFVISASEARLPLLIEDAMRPETDVNLFLVVVLLLLLHLKI